MKVALKCLKHTTKQKKKKQRVRVNTSMQFIPSTSLPLSAPVNPLHDLLLPCMIHAARTRLPVQAEAEPPQPKQQPQPHPFFLIRGQFSVTFLFGTHHFLPLSSSSSSFALLVEEAAWTVLMLRAPFAPSCSVRRVKPKGKGLLMMQPPCKV